MNLRKSALLLLTSVLVFSVLYYLATLHSDDLGLLGASKLDTVANCMYESVMVSTFGSPVSPPDSATAALMIVVNRVVTVVLIVLCVLASIRQTAVSMS